MIDDGQPPKRDDSILVNIQGLIESKCQDLRALIADLRQTVDARVDAKFVAVEDKINYQAKSAQVALDKAFESSQLAIQELKGTTASRFESVNEFRLTLKDQVSTFATRKEFDTLRELVVEKMSKTEYDSRHSVLENKIDNISHKIDEHYSKGDINELFKSYSNDVKKVADRQWAMIVLIIAALIGVIFDFMTRR
jgi:hypothetical protein